MVAVVAKKSVQEGRLDKHGERAGGRAAVTSGRRLLRKSVSSRLFRLLLQRAGCCVSVMLLPLPQSPHPHPPSYQQDIVGRPPAFAMPHCQPSSLAARLLTRAVWPSGSLSLATFPPPPQPNHLVLLSLPPPPNLIEDRPARDVLSGQLGRDGRQGSLDQRLQAASQSSSCHDLEVGGRELRTMSWQMEASGHELHVRAGGLAGQAAFGEAGLVLGQRLSG